ncbi:MAG: CvpA family protein [Alphaproteobacteria bacterium]
MEILGFNITDLVVFAVVVLGALVGLALGFIKGGLIVLSWIGAIFATLYGFPTLRPYTRKVIETEMIADVAAGVALFLVTLLVLFLISSLVGSWVRNSRLNALDRSVGMLAGLGTAASLVCAAYLVLGAVQPRAEQPQWLRTARTMPLIERGAEILVTLMPERFGLGPAAPDDAERRARRRKEAERAVRELTTSRTQPAAPDGGSGYKKEERREMDRLIQGAQ